MKQSRMITMGVFAFILILVVVMLSSATFLTIEPGEKGVLFRRFSGGLEMEQIYSAGFHIVAPWNKMEIYEVREKQQEEEMEVLSSNGLNIKVDVTVRVHPIYEKLPLLHEKFGSDYMNSLVRPEMRSSVRQIIGQFTPEELYSSRRDEVQKLIQENLEATLSNNYIALRATLIRDIALPQKVRAAIEDKIEAEQTALKYEYVLDRERKEAERKIIEAEAKAESNRILNTSLSANILRDKGIEATMELANSPNTKVIVVGGGEDGLPLILGNQR